MLDDGLYSNLMANAVHPSESADVHDSIFSTLIGKYSTLDLDDSICSTLDDKCSTPK